MCDAWDSYLNATFSRDKVMAIVQFLPLALAAPSQAVGGPALCKSLHNLSTMADKYRAITRLSLLLHALSKKTLKTLSTPQGDVVLDRADQLGHFFHVFYLVFENTAVLASHGVYNSSLTRLGGCAVTCWFYVLLTTILRNLYVLASKDKLTPEQRRKEHISILKHGCFIVFALTCIPQGGPKLLEDVSGPLAPLHHALRLIAPKHLALDDTYRGALGFVASMCDFA